MASQYSVEQEQEHRQETFLELEKFLHRPDPIQTWHPSESNLVMKSGMKR
jgi:hypothetical protein